MKRLASLLLAAVLATGALGPAADAAPTPVAAVARQTDVVTLINTTMRAFAKAVGEKNMEGFAPRFVNFAGKAEILEGNYRVFYEHAAAFADLGAYVPVVQTLAADDARRLVLQGFYPGAKRIEFEMVFVRENNELKLARFAVKLTAPASISA